MGDMSQQPDDLLPAEPEPPRQRALTFAAQELRLISALVLLLAIGLFLALPFVLSIGAVVFLPLVTAIMLTIVLSPLADRLAQGGLPNVLASLLALLVFLAVLVIALTVVLRPAVGMYDQLPGDDRQDRAAFPPVAAQLQVGPAARRAGERDHRPGRPPASRRRRPVDARAGRCRNAHRAAGGTADDPDGLLHDRSAGARSPAPVARPPARRREPQGRAGHPRRAGPGRGLHPDRRADQSGASG